MTPTHRDLPDLVRALRTYWGERLDAVVLFGSRARGDADEYSDWDFLIIIRGLTWEEKQDIERKWRRMVGQPWNFLAAPVFCSEGWYDQRPSAFSMNIAWEGIVIFDAQGRMRDWITRYRKALVETGWRRIVRGKEIWWENKRGVVPGWWKELQEKAA